MKIFILISLSLLLSFNPKQKLQEPESRSGVGFRYVDHPEPPARLFVGKVMILDSEILESLKQPQVKLSQLVISAEEHIEMMEGDWTFQGIRRNETGAGGWYWVFHFVEHNDDENDRFYTILALNNGKLFLPELKTYDLKTELDIIRALQPPMK